MLCHSLQCYHCFLLNSLLFVMFCSTVEFKVNLPLFKLHSDLTLYRQIENVLYKQYFIPHFLRCVTIQPWWRTGLRHWYLKFKQIIMLLRSQVQLPLGTYLPFLEVIQWTVLWSYGITQVSRVFPHAGCPFWINTTVYCKMCPQMGTSIQCF